MESGGEAMDDHCPRWVPVKKKHRSGSKFSVQSWAGGFSGKNGSCYQLPISSVGEKFSNLAGKDRYELSKGAKNYAYTDDNVIANFEKPSNLEKTKENGSPPKLVESHVFQNSVVAEDNLEVQQKDGTETVPKIRSGDIDDGHILVLYPEGMHEGNVKSSDKENSSLVTLNDESGNRLISPSFSCTDFQETKSGFTAVVTNVCPRSLIPLENKEVKNAENNGKLSIISLWASNNVSESSERHGESCEPLDNCLHIESLSYKETGVEENFQVPVLVHEVDDSGIQELPDISEVSSSLSSSDCVSFYTEKSDNGISGEDRNQFKLEPYEENASELSTSLIEKLESPFFLEGNKPIIPNSSSIIEEAGMLTQLQFPLLLAFEEKQTEVNVSLVEESGVEVECHSPVVSVGNELEKELEVSESQVKLHESDMLPLKFKEDESRIDESLITDEKLGIIVGHKLPLTYERNESISTNESRISKSLFLVEQNLTSLSEVNESITSVPPVTVVDPQLLLISKGNELRVLPSPDTAEKLSVLVEPQLSENYELRAESPIVVKKAEVMVESPFPLTSKEADFIIPELSTTLEKSGTEIEPSSPLVHEENELRVSKSPVTIGKVDLVESHFPFISSKSYLRVAESPIAIEKTDFVAKSEIPLISKDKEFRFSESSITIDKCRTMVEPSMPLNFKENSVSEVNESRISVPQVMVADPELLLMYKGNELRALQLPSTIEKLGVVVEPQVPQEYESRDESPVVKISKNMVESPLHHTSKEANFRVTELTANLEKSRKEIEPSSPLVHEEIESRVPEPLVTIEKANLAVESQVLFVSGENDLRVVGSPVGIGQVDIVAESELPLISKEKEFKVSESLVTIERLGTMVEPSFLPSLKEDESRVTEVNEPKNSVSPVTVVDPQYLLMSQGNELSVLQFQGIVEKLDVVVKPQVPQEYESRVESRVVQKSENMVESLLPLTSKEVDYRVTEVSDTLENSRTEIETSSPLVPEETELRVPESPITIEKANFAVESQFPFVSRENDLRVAESPVDIGKGDIVAEFELPLTSEEKEFIVSEPPVIIERSGTMVELSLPVSFKENESSVYEVNGSRNYVSPFTAVDAQYLIMHKGNELRDLRFPGSVEKLGMVVEPQVPREHELKAESLVAVKKEQIMVEPTLSLTAEEADFKFSELSATLEKLGIDIEPPSPLVLEAVESRVRESPVTMENTNMVVKSHFPSVSRGNDLRVFESPVPIGKADIMTESKLHLISQEKEFRVYESPVKVEKLGTVVESSLSVSLKENKSIVSEVNESRIYVSPGMMVDSHSLLMSKGNESRVLQSSCTVEKLDVVIDPYVPEEYELRAKPLTEIKKAEIMVETPLSLTSKEGDFRVVELSATIEKSRTEIEPPSPLVPKENESRFLESPFTVEKANLDFDSHNSLVSKENDLRIVESPVSIRKENIIDASELPLISEEKEFRVSKPPVTILKSETMVEPSFPLSLEENESRVFNEPITTERADMMVKSGSPLPSNENVLEDPMSSVTTEKSDLMVEPQLPIFSKENCSRASDFPFRVEKLDTLVGSQLPLISEEQKSRASESPVIIHKSYIVIESQLPHTSKENELKFYKSPITMEKLDMFAESHVPLISKDNNSRALEPLRTVELSDIVSGSQFPLMCEENKLSVSKSQVSFAKSDVLFESHIPPISKKNEFRTLKRPDIIEKSDMVVGSQLSLVSIENESRVSKSHVTVEKLNTETESQLPWISKEKESRMLDSEFSIDKSDRVAETELSFTSKENASRASDLQIIVTNQEGKSRVPEAQNSSMVAKVQTSLSLTSKGNESRGVVMPFGKPDVVVEPQVPNICKENESVVSDFPSRSERSGTMVEPRSHCLPLTYEGNESIYHDPLLRVGTSSTLATQTETASSIPQRCVSEVSREYNTVVKLNFPCTLEENGLRESQVSIINKFPSSEVLSKDSNLLTSEKIGHAIPLVLSQKTSVGNMESSIYTSVCDDLQKIHNQSDKSEGDAGESKERFGDRLWGFLFENLNKSVDELYLLCGLECDIDQMKEAVLVLEEAAYDFNELTAWVQEFDKVKRSSQSVDNAMSDLRFDHRRPHALSWEVRRMATSSHRVDILPSSLEAFKKIHQERADILTANTSKNPTLGGSSHHHVAAAERQKPVVDSLKESHVGDSVIRVEQESRCLDVKKQNSDDQLNVEPASCNKVNFIQNGYDHLKSFSGLDSHHVMHKLDISATLEARKTKRVHKVEKVEANDHPKNHTHSSENDKDRRNSMTFKSMDAWKEKRRWAERIPSPGTNSRKSVERARVLPDRLISPEKKKRTAIDWKKEAEEKHARARRIRNELENERVQKLQRSLEKLNRVNEWQAARSIKLQEEMHARRQTGESRHEAYLAQVARRAGDESSKVNEVRFITSLNEEKKKIKLRQKLHDSEVRRAEKVQVRKSKQKEGMAREEAVLERRKLIEAEKVQRLADTQRRKEEARVRREEERKALSAVREARIMEQLRKREERVKAQQEETEMLARKLAERLRESEQRRKFHLDQIRERASMDFRDQSSQLPRRPVSRDGQERSSSSTNSGEDFEERDPTLGPRGHALDPGMQQDLLKRQIKKIRQRLMAQKYEFIEPPIGCENSSFGYRTALGTARAKLGRWIQELQRLRQARKEGASSIGLTIADMIKFIEGRDPELQASRQAGLLDFIASALPASHTSKPEACRVTVHLLKLLRVVLSMPTNRSYFLAQNLLPPIVPMLFAALENYIKIVASSNVHGCAIISSNKASVENKGPVSEVLDNFLWIVGAIISHNAGSDEREIQMQDGLVELLIAYQIIHRLRDLFALYDNPHVEGLPFPSSILLGVHLLVVLTDRARRSNSINWESSPIGMMLDIGNQQKNFEMTSNFRNNSSNEISGCDNTPLSRLQATIVVPPDPPVQRSSDVVKNDDPESVSKYGATSQTHSLFDLNGVTVKLTNITRETHINQEMVVKQLDIIDEEQKNNNLVSMNQATTDLLSAISETGLVSLPSLFTSVLLQTSNRPFSEQGSYVLPSNFEEVATGVLKVLNNLALVDISFIQRMLAMPDLKMEFFHLMSFLLSHCTSKWRGATDQIGLLLLESLLLIGYFALFHPENQAVLRWGKSPTILHKVCDLPFAFFSDPELMPVLAGTLVAACYGCEQNKSLVQQEMCVDMLLSLIRSCSGKPNATTDNHPPAEDCSESSNHEFKSSPGGYDNPLKCSHNHVVRPRPSRYSLGGRSSVVSASSIRTGKLRRAGKTGEEMGLKPQSLGAPPEASTMLHCRFSTGFINKAEDFFTSVDENV